MRKAARPNILGQIAPNRRSPNHCSTARGLLPVLITLTGLVSACSMETVNEQPVSKDDIRQTVKLNAKDVRVCYEKALEETPMLEGRVVMEWRIGPDGKPLDLRVRQASPKIQAVTPCLIEKMKNWVFPHDHPETIVTVAYPFIFSENNQFKRVQEESAEKDAK